MTLSPHFVCLSMCITGRAWGDSRNLSMMDCLVWAIERDDDPVDLPPLVARTVSDFTRWATYDAAIDQAMAKDKP